MMAVEAACTHFCLGFLTGSDPYADLETTPYIMETCTSRILLGEQVSGWDSAVLAGVTVVESTWTGCQRPHWRMAGTALDSITFTAPPDLCPPTPSLYSSDQVLRSTLSSPRGLAASGPTGEWLVRPSTVSP